MLKGRIQEITYLKKKNNVTLCFMLQNIYVNNTYIHQLQCHHP